MSGEIADGSSSDSTDPPSLADLAIHPKVLQPLYAHRNPPGPVVANLLPKLDEVGQTPRLLAESTARSLRTQRSNLYNLVTCRSKQMFVDVKKTDNYAPPANPLSNPMAVHLARRQAQAARIMAGEDAENAMLFRPCRIDLKYKSPRRLRQIFRRRSSQSPWASQYLGDNYYPVEVAQEFSRWNTGNPNSGSTDLKLLPLISLESPNRADATDNCCVRYVWPLKQLEQAQNSADLINKSASFATTARSQRNKNKGFTDSELAWAMSRTCRVRKPWATIIEKQRASHGELRYAGIKLLAGLLEARAGWQPAHYNDGDMSAAVRCLCYEDECSRLDYIKRRKNEPCAPDWVLQLMMPLIAPLIPRRGYTLLSETTEKAQAHCNSLSESALMEVQNNLCHLNLTQLAHLRLAFPEQGPDGSLRKVRLKDLISSCEQHIGQRFWQFLSERVRPSSAIYEALMEKATDALMTHAILPCQIAPPNTSKIMSDWSSTVSSTPSDRHRSLDSAASQLDGHGFRSLLDYNGENVLDFGSAQYTHNFVELPKLRLPVRQSLGLAFLELLGSLALSKDTRAELLEEPVTTLSDNQSWWLLFTEELTKNTQVKERGARKEPGYELSSVIPLDVIGEQFTMCFIRLPSLELRFARPEEVDIFTINEMVAPDTRGGRSVWAIRVIPPEVEDLSSFAPVNPSAHLNGLYLSEVFKKRREHAEANALTSADVHTNLKPRQRLRSVSRTRTRIESPMKTLSTMVSTRPLSAKMLRRAPTTMQDWLANSSSQQAVAEINVYGTSAV